MFLSTTIGIKADGLIQHSLLPCAKFAMGLAIMFKLLMDGGQAYFNATKLCQSRSRSL